MQSPKFNTIVKEADALLYSATEELKKSKNDLLTYQACNNSRESIRKYLTSFLLKNEVEPQEPVTLASLLDQCKAIDKKFALIDLSGILCRHDAVYDDYCLDAVKVKQCLKVAEQTRKITLG
jgi:hypothetical protein